MASHLEVRVEVRDCAKLVKVVIKKFDDRNGERIMRIEILVLLGVLLTCYRARVTFG